MNSEPSRTALTACAARAAHALVDAEPHIFTDPLAVRILGDRAEELLGYHKVSGTHPVLRGARTQVVVRSYYTERRLAEAVTEGVSQYVLLGAGLDTFGYRSTLPVRVFEVDHPATQEWKRVQLDGAGLAIPGTVALVPVDLEADSLAEALGAAGFDPSAPAFVGWLGVTMYLTEDSVANTLATLGNFAPGTHLVAGYMVPPHLRDAAGQSYVDAIEPVAAEGGEPWLSTFTPEEMAALVREHGFTPIEDVGQHEALEPHLWQRTDGLAPSTLSRLVHAKNGGMTVLR